MIRKDIEATFLPAASLSKAAASSHDELWRRANAFMDRGEQLPPVGSFRGLPGAEESFARELACLTQALELLAKQEAGGVALLPLEGPGPPPPAGRGLLRLASVWIASAAALLLLVGRAPRPALEPTPAFATELDSPRASGVLGWSVSERIDFAGDSIESVVDANGKRSSIQTSNARRVQAPAGESTHSRVLDTKLTRSRWRPRGTAAIAMLHFSDSDNGAQQRAGTR